MLPLGGQISSSQELLIQDYLNRFDCVHVSTVYSTTKLSTGIPLRGRRCGRHSPANRPGIPAERLQFEHLSVSPGLSRQRRAALAGLTVLFSARRSAVSNRRAFRGYRTRRAVSINPPGSSAGRSATSLDPVRRTITVSLSSTTRFARWLVYVVSRAIVNYCAGFLYGPVLRGLML